jgi:hypothetical protein
MENAGIFYGHLEYFTVIWYILWPLGNVVVIWYIFTRFGIYVVSRKIWQTWVGQTSLYRQFSFFHYHNYFYSDSCPLFSHQHTYTGGRYGRMWLLVLCWEPSSSRVARWFIFKPKIPVWVLEGLGLE